MNELKIKKFNNIISIIGYSNTGKSYIFNKLLNNNKSIINKKEQFTRKIIIDILYIKNNINLLIDTPGILLKKKYKLHKLMLSYIKESIKTSNIILYTTINKKFFLNKDKKILFKYCKLLNKKKKILIIFNNKKNKINNFYIKYFNIKNIIIINNNNFKYLYKKINNINNNKKKYKFVFNYNYNISNYSNYLFFFSEIIRYYIYNIYKKEIPYSTEIKIYNFFLKKDKLYIYCLIYLEKKSQKIIFIGNKGLKINLLSFLIRKRIKYIYNINKVYIDFIIKIIKWKNNNNYLKNFGYF